LQDFYDNQEQQSYPKFEDKEEEKAESVKVVNYDQRISRESLWDDNDNRGFSLFGLVESMLSIVASGFSKVVSRIAGVEKKNLQSHVRRVNYRNYQLIRLFPNTENHIADLRDMTNAEPEEIKFWSFPKLNRFVFLFLTCNRKLSVT